MRKKLKNLLTDYLRGESTDERHAPALQLQIDAIAAHSVARLVRRISNAAAPRAKSGTVDGSGTNSCITPLKLCRPIRAAGGLICPPIALTLKVKEANPPKASFQEVILPPSLFQTRSC